MSNHRITVILYQAGHRDIQKDIGLAMRDWYFQEGFLERSDAYPSADVGSSTLIQAL